MHPLAKDWDLKHGRSVKRHTVKKGQYVPKNRPCDRCGLLVKSGYIHSKCWSEERKELLDILY